MSREISILCDEAELAVDAAHLAETIGVATAPRVSERAVDEAMEHIARGERVALALSAPPRPSALVALSDAAKLRSEALAIAIVGDSPTARDARDLAGDVGLITVDELRPLFAVIALMEAGVGLPPPTPLRGLAPSDRARMSSRRAETAGGTLERLDGSLLGYAYEAAPLRAIGEPRDVSAALEAMSRVNSGHRPAMPTVEGVPAQAVLDVILGPARALSDPASKSVLDAYDIPLPLEELCASPSRAASEASRIGFPVRIALASPDLRIWDHPDLAADGVDNAARVRDVFRQTMALARARAPEARLLGVTVSATTSERAFLRFRATPMDHGLVLAELGFADPHGLAAEDRTFTILPAGADALERVLERLAGSPLLLAGDATQRRRTISDLGDAFLRIAAFVSDFRDEISSVEVDPLALLVGGGVEVREACVTVSDAFQRSLDAPPRASQSEHKVEPAEAKLGPA